MLLWKCNILKIVLKYHNCKTDKIPFKSVHDKKIAVRPVETVNQANIRSFVLHNAFWQHFGGDRNQSNLLIPASLYLCCMVYQ